MTTYIIDAYKEGATVQAEKVKFFELMIAHLEKLFPDPDILHNLMILSDTQLLSYQRGKYVDSIRKINERARDAVAEFGTWKITREY